MARPRALPSSAVTSSLVVGNPRCNAIVCRRSSSGKSWEDDAFFFAEKRVSVRDA